MNLSGTLRLNKFACFTLIFILFLIIYWQSGGTTYPTDANDLVNLRNLLKASILAAELGGTMVTEGHKKALNVKSKGKTAEGANQLVTAADYASHCAMFNSLKKTFPRVSLVSEEHTDANAPCDDVPVLDVDQSIPKQGEINMIMDELVYAKDITVWIDPLDATQEFTEDLLQYVTTMVCVAIKGIPIIGVIHYPFPPRTYWGWYTKRASSNIPNVQRRDPTKQSPRVTISRSHKGNVAEIAREAFGPETLVTPAGGAGYKVMAVVNGTYDIYLHATAIKKWDICAGDAIIKSVDGRMTTAKGDNIDYSTDSPFIVTDGILVSRFLWLQNLRQPNYLKVEKNFQFLYSRQCPQVLGCVRGGPLFQQNNTRDFIIMFQGYHADAEGGYVFIRALLMTGLNSKRPTHSPVETNVSVIFLVVNFTVRTINDDS